MQRSPADARRGISASTRDGRRSTTPVSAGHSRTRSTGTRCRRPSEQTAAATGGLLPPTMPGHSHRVAPAFDPDRARALLSEAGYPDGRGLGEIVLAYLKIYGRSGVRHRRPARGVGVPVRRLPADSVPDLDGRDQGARSRLPLGLVASTSPIRAAASSSRSSAGVRSFYRDEQLEQLLARAAIAPRPGRAPAHVPRVRAHLDRRASGRGAARLQRPPVVAAPVGHGHVGERDREVDVRRGRPTAGTAFHAGTRLMRREPSERRHDGLSAAPCSPPGRTTSRRA